VLAVAPAPARLLRLDVVAQLARLLVQRRATLAHDLVRVRHHHEVLAAALLGVGRRVRLRVELLVAVRPKLVPVGAALLDLQEVGCECRSASGTGLGKSPTRREGRRTLAMRSS